MELNDTTSTDFSGFSQSDQSTEGVNEISVNNGEQYSTVDTCLGECVTFSFHDQTTYDRFMKDLTTLYNFHPNKDQTAVTTTTDVEGTRLVITCYNTHKMVVQGVMALSWKRTIFNHLAEKLKTLENLKESEPLQTKKQNPPMRKSKSLITRIRDLTGSSDDKYMKEVKRAQKLGDREYEKKLVEGWRAGTDIKTIKKGATPVNMHLGQKRSINTDQTHVKKIAHNHTESRVGQRGPIPILIPTMIPKAKSSSTPKKEKKTTDEEKGTQTALFSSDTQSCTQTCSTDPEEAKDYTNKSKVEDLVMQDDLHKQELKQLKKENQKLTARNEEQANKMAKLLDCAEALKKTLHDTQAKASEQSNHINVLSTKSKELENQLVESTANIQLEQKKSKEAKERNKKLENEVKEMKERIAAKNGECLIHEEEIKKLKQTIKQMKDENHKLSNKVSKQSYHKECCSDRESSLVEEVTGLKGDLHQLKSQMTIQTETSQDILAAMSNTNEEIETIKTSIDQIKRKVEQAVLPTDIEKLRAEMHKPPNKQTANQNIVSQNENEPINVDNYQPQPAKTKAASQKPEGPSGSESENTRQKKCIYILGDSTTKVLNTKRLSGDKYSVTIKSHPGALIKDINNKVRSLSNEDQRLKTCDAVLVHAGINNISEAHPPDDIMNQYDELITTIKKVNRGAKIIVSSILPKKTDKLSLKSISEVNFKLKQKCSSEMEQMCFMDNTPRFTNENNVLVNLYTDEIHLSSRGAAILAKNIMDAVNKALKTGYNTKSKQAGNFRQSSLQKTMGQYQYYHSRGPPRRTGPRRSQGLPRSQGPPVGRIPPWMRMAQYWGPPPHYY